jgi:hypothetical protein
MRRSTVIIFLLFNFSCVGVDVLDDPIDLLKGNTIVFLNTESNMLALRTGDSFEVEAVYFDQYGIQRDYTLTWQSEDESIATANDGKVEGKEAGTTTVVVTYLDASKALQVTVVNNSLEVASVVIETPSSASLNLLEEVQLAASVRNIDGETLPDKTIEWFTENEALATVSSTGLVKAVANGVVEVHAKSEGVKSNSIIFTIGSSNERQGNFVPAGGYQAKGSATLSNIDGELILKLSDDFQTSFALGTYIYLANSTSGSQVKAGGFEIAQITTNGAKTFNISGLNASITIDQYKYVIILCKPASVTFGYAEMN